MGKCSICHKREEKLTQLDINLNSRNGISVCNVCLSAITAQVKTLEFMATKVYLRGFGDGKKQ